MTPEEKQMHWSRSLRRGPSIFGEIMLKMSENGELDGLEGESLLEHVADAAELYLENEVHHRR